MSDQVGIAIVGVGWWGRVLADAVGRSEQARVVAGFSRTASSRDSFAADYDCSSPKSLDELLADDAVEGVMYATPHTLHREHIEKAAAAGVHTFVEKPFALNSVDGRAAVNAAAAGGVHLMVGHQRRRQVANRRLRAMADDGTFGTLIHGEASTCVPKGYPDTWRSQREETPLGGMTALGVHHIDTYHYLMGEIGRVSAFSNAVLPDQPLDQATGLLFEMKSGAVATLLTSHFVAAANNIAIHGSAGSGFNEGDGRRLFTQARTATERTEHTIEPNDTLVDSVDEFAGAIRGTATIETDGEGGLAVVSVLEAAIASAARGAAVDVAEFSN
jgi:predicted dehydrogenase